MRLTLIVSQTEGLTPPIKGPTAFKAQLQQEGTHNPPEIFLEHRTQVIWKIVPLSLARHLHHKAIITSLGVIADITNTEKKWGDKEMCPPKK